MPETATSPRCSPSSTLIREVAAAELLPLARSAAAGTLDDAGLRRASAAAAAAGDGRVGRSLHIQKGDDGAAAAARRPARRRHRPRVSPSPTRRPDRGRTQSTANPGGAPHARRRRDRCTCNHPPRWRSRTWTPWSGSTPRSREVSAARLPSSAGWHCRCCASPGQRSCGRGASRRSRPGRLHHGAARDAGGFEASAAPALAWRPEGGGRRVRTGAASVGRLRRSSTSPGATHRRVPPRRPWRNHRMLTWPDATASSLAGSLIVDCAVGEGWPQAERGAAGPA